MDFRLKRIDCELKKYDRCLYAVRSGSGMLQVHRKAEHWSAADFVTTPTAESPYPQLILCLTDTWKYEGKPVEWGLEPLMREIRSRDGWAQALSFEQMLKNRENAERMKKESLQREMRARAYDVRRDFARATNDINTSTLEKVDRRRK